MAKILQFITAEDERELLAGAGRREFQAGETILGEGERRTALFTLRSGRAAVERSHGEYSVEVSELGPGEIFGEMGFVEDTPASASVVAREPCSVLVVEESQVRAMVAKDPGFSGRFYRSVAHILSRRLRATTVQALSEFSWGTGFVTGSPREEEPEPPPGWGGGSPLRGER